MTSARMRGPPLRPVNGRDLWTDHHHTNNNNNRHSYKDVHYNFETRATPCYPISSNNRNRLNASVGKRKSAVELLQETKAFYVKSELVRDRKQEFRPTRSPDSCTMAPSHPPKSPRCSSYNATQNTSELQNRLRLLLDFDSKENYDNRYNRSHRLYGEGPPYREYESGMTTCYTQHKSLPDLHLSPNHSDTESSESSYTGCRSRRTDARSLYSNGTQHGGLSLVALSTKSSDCRRGGYLLHNSEFTVADPRLYASLRVTKSGEAIYPRAFENVWRRNSNTSSGNRSLHNSSSRHSQSADSGRLSQVGSSGLRTGKSGLPEVMSPQPALPDTTSEDSGAEDGSPPLYRSDSYERRRPVLRSKSDTSHRYCQVPLTISQNTNPPLMALSQLERFFNNLGMDPAAYSEMANCSSPVSRSSSSPVFFSSVSSLDSYTLEQQQYNSAPVLPPVPEPWERPCEPVMSVVERNARIIKWLCGCRKAQMQRCGLTLV